ncbi:MAG: HEAT repeat domain-containing protein, partial [Sandaracinus sp.]|nr:HEAT repeat domain-containing protein [Sandaracinus sp.]
MDAATHKYVPFRGKLVAGGATGAKVAFVTAHVEGKPTPLYRYDLDAGTLEATATMPAATCGVASADTLFVGCADGHVRAIGLASGEPTVLGDAFEKAPSALAVVGDARLAVGVESTLFVIDARTGARIASYAMPDAITAVAVDATGAWLAVGTAQGNLVALGAEEGETHVVGDTQKLHGSAITCALFDPDEPRVYTSGLDQRLLLTHVRGTLEAEDRAGGAAHDGAIHALALGPEDKLYTASQDGTIRTWLRGAGRKRPSTLRDAGRGRVLLVAERQGRAQLVSLGDDETLRVFPLDAGGKVGERALSVHDVYAWARQELGASDAKRREKALVDLAALDDAAAIALLAERAGSDPDHALKVEATNLLGRSGNPRAVEPLERLIRAPEEKVRLAALAGLRALVGAGDLRPLELALQAKKRDVGVEAVDALVTLAARDDEASARLVKALEDEPVEVRQAALRGLETLHGESPEASRIALRSARPDVRRAALVRLFERGLLTAAGVGVLLRRHVDDPDANVRAMAFLVSVASQPPLAEALRAVDEDLDRRLTELETPEGEASEEAEAKDDSKKAAKKPKKAAKKASKKKSDDSLDDEALRPLLEALASRAADTCLEGAKALAALEDARAFGTLLQLSSAAEPAVRVAAAAALSRLGDPRAMPRVRQMLRDGAREVRDAALSALVRLEDDDPIRAAEIALDVPHEDVRARALQLVVRATKKALKDGKSKEIERLSGLLAHALDDAAAAVRSEAFKAVLSQEVGGGADGTLRFALRSAHADVRRDVLSEVMGRIQEPWANGLLLELFADADSKLRADAFAFAQKRSKGKSLEPLAAALAAPHADLKLEAVDALRKRHVEGARALLVAALDDADAKVRLAAVEGLAIDEAADALRAALDSKHADVRARAACALAELGDASSLAALTALVTADEPELAEEREAWRDRLVRALGGLGELGDTKAESVVRELVTHRDVTIRRAATAALGWLATDDASRAALAARLADEDAAVKLEAASSLALVGDRAGLPLLVGAAKQLDVATRGLHAALALGDAELLGSFLDSALDVVRSRALLATMMIESSERDGVPDRCIAALSARHPRTRLVAARALEVFADDDAFATWVTELFNEREDERAPWTFPHEAVVGLADALTHGAATLRVRIARLLETREDTEPQRLERAYARLSARFGDALKPKKRAAVEVAYAPEEMRRVVAGAYAGLSRHPGGGLDARVRQTAIARLVEVAKADEALGTTVRPILKMALADADLAVRKVAFDALGALGLPAAELAEEAISVGFRDLGVAGLRLLAEAGKGDEGTRVLEQTYLTDTNGLEQEAGKLLAESLGWVATYTKGLEAKSARIRDEAVRGLARLHAEPKSPDALRAALASTFEHVRQGAALELGVLKDASAFDPLVAMLRSRRQTEAMGALGKLGDPRATDAWIDRVVDDPAGDAQVPALLAAVGRFRRPENAERLLALVDDVRRRKAAFDALIVLSGYDQPILDGDSDDPAVTVLQRNRRVSFAADWQAQQHPRHDAVLAQTLDAALRVADVATIGRLLPFAQWAKGSELDAVLARVCTSTNDAHRDRAVSGYGFRARFRGADAKVLVEALGSTAPRTQLLAAEALAWAVRADGMKVLLAAVDTMPELNDRRRAVRALG